MTPIPPEYQQHVEASLDDVEALRRHTAASLGHDEHSEAHARERQRALEITGKLQLLCVREGLDLDRLLGFANDRIDLDRRHDALFGKAVAA